MKIPKAALTLALILCSGAAFSQAKRSALDIKTEALKAEDVLDVIAYLNDNASSAATDADTRSLLYFTGALQEQAGLYTDAAASYARAAGIAARDADGMDSVTTDELVLSAVRASLCAGDWEQARSYLNSAVQNSADTEVQAKLRLYSVWCDLCRAESDESAGADISDCVSMLKAFCEMNSMESVRAEVLYTLYHVTGNDTYADALKRDFPASPEAAIVEGNAHIMRSPFWYFVPRLDDAESGDAAPEDTAAGDDGAGAAESAPDPAESPAPQGEDEIKVKEKHAGPKQQLGLFRERQNAAACVSRARGAGFDAYCYTETRASGTTYFIVAVDDPERAMGQRLRGAGFDCYEVE